MVSRASSSTICSAREELEIPWVPGDLFSRDLFLRPHLSSKKERADAVPGSSLITGKTGASVPAVKPRSDRRNTMKSSTKDQAEGKFHKVKGKIKEIAGKVSLNPI
jgi:hypothetical protein